MKLFYLLTLCIFTVNIYALQTLKIGVLAFGTVNWELQAMQNNKLPLKYGIKIEIKKLASKNAVSIALQARTVDVIVSDFIWVSRQRASGADFTYYPYSKATGGLYIRPELKINSILDLKNHKIGISGGPVSKTWLIMRAYSKLKYNKDFKDIIKPVFASPPILNRKVLDSSIKGAINFWHFNAKLRSKGMIEILSMKTMLNEFGIKYDIPLIGWVFREKFALKNKELINSFLQASYETKKILNTKPDEWNKIRHLMKAKDKNTFEALIDGYKAGIPKKFSKNEKEAAKKIFNILAKVGGSKLVGKSKTLKNGTFWDFNPNIIW